MVNCYFDNKNYYFTDGDGGFTFFAGSDSVAMWKLSSDYQRSYLLLMNMIADLKVNGIKNVKIHHNTRIVEEVGGVIKPMNTWGNNALLIIRRNYLPYLIDYSIVKISSEELASVISEGRKNIQHSCDIDPSKLLQSFKQKRFRRFKRRFSKEDVQN